MFDNLAWASLFAGLLGFSFWEMLFFFGGVLVVVILPYFYLGHMYYCIGRKANLSRDLDWMAYLPFAREIYRCKIVRMPVWYFLFLPGLTNSLLLGIILGVFTLLDLVPLAIVFWLAFWLASKIFTYLYFAEFYKDFGFNPNMAFAAILPLFNIIALLAVFLMIAYGNAFQYKTRNGIFNERNEGGQHNDPVSRAAEPSGAVVGVAGKYAGFSFDVKNGETIVLGRSAEKANVVFDDMETDLSRWHCSVRYEAMNSCYVLRDESVNGTYASSGERYPKGQEIRLNPGTVIYLGKMKKEAFRLK